MRAVFLGADDVSPPMPPFEVRRIVTVHAGVVETMRQLKPSIPRAGLDGIPMRDETLLEIAL